MHTLISPIVRLASVGLFALPQSLFAAPLAPIPGAVLERPLFVIQQACGSRKTAALEPFLVPTLDEDDEPEEVEGKGNSIFERPVKGRMPLSPKQHGLPADNEANFIILACMNHTPALDKLRKENREKQEKAERLKAQQQPPLLLGNPPR